jgi:sulfatase modifying factor 1
MKIETTQVLRLLAPLVIWLAFSTHTKADVFNMPAGQTSLQFVTVGTPGNAPDTVVESDGTSGYGSVSYDYSIGKYDVTDAQYALFLNAKDPTGANNLGLYNTLMGQPSQEGGISFDSNNANGSKYSVLSGAANLPVNFVTWYSAVRFINWLNNGQGNGDTEMGAYALAGGTPTPSNPDGIQRNTDATYFLPSENEWYKAAYYNPVTQSYFRYATSSNSIPTASNPTAVPNSANFDDGGNGLTTVGAYSQTTSPYGAFDMCGDAEQWIEQSGGGGSRGLRGDGYLASPQVISSAQRHFDSADGGGFTDSFRVVLVPEPSTFTLAVLAALIVGLFRRNG